MRRGHWRMVTILVCVLAVIGLAPVRSAGQSGASLTLVVASSPGVGQAFTVDVVVDTPLASRGAQFGLAFDPRKLRVEGIETGAFYDDWATNNGGSVSVIPGPRVDNLLGTVSPVVVVIVGGTMGGPIGRGVVASYRFTALEAGPAILALSNAMIMNADADGVGAIPGIVHQPITLDISREESTPSHDPTTPTVAPLKTGAEPDAPIAGTLTVTPTDNPVITTPTAPPAPAPLLTEPPNSSGVSTHKHFLALILHQYKPPEPSIRLSPPQPITGWFLRPGNNTTQATLSVASSGNWVVEVGALEPDDWHMAEYDGAQWVPGGGRAAEPLHVRVPTNGNDVSDGTSGRLTTGTGSQDVQLEFYQVLHHADALPAEGNTYRIILVFTGYLEL